MGRTLQELSIRGNVRQAGRNNAILFYVIIYVKKNMENLEMSYASGKFKRKNEKKGKKVKEKKKKREKERERKYPGRNIVIDLF